MAYHVHACNQYFQRKRLLTTSQLQQVSPITLIIRIQYYFDKKCRYFYFFVFLLSGLYGASHGVTANVVYDNKLRKVLKYSAELFMLKPNVTPIWTLAELSGKRSAVSMWSAGEFPFRGIKPTYFESFNRSMPWKQRIDNLIPALTRNASQIDLVMFYVDHPDFEAHASSSQSKQVSHIRLFTIEIES